MYVTRTYALLRIECGDIDRNSATLATLPRVRHSHSHMLVLVRIRPGES